MSKLVIAEKPMLARDIARAITGKEVSESARLPISGNGYTVCACAGHLLELVKPDTIDPKWGNPWSLDVLPIEVHDWPKEPAVDKETGESKKPLIDQIAGLLKTCDSVIAAGDPDDEGQLIVDELLDYLGYTGKVERVYVNDNIEKNIVRAFDKLVPNDSCRGAGNAAYARQMADMCFGVNESRLATKRLDGLFTVGRVQTPTLGLVVKRDEAIAHHVTRKFYELFASGDSDAGELTFKYLPGKELLAGEKHLFERHTLEALKEKLDGRDLHFETTVSKKQENPPLPYNLTVLLSDMSERFGFTAAETQQITQLDDVVWLKKDGEKLLWREGDELINGERFFAMEQLCYSDATVQSINRRAIAVFDYLKHAHPTYPDDEIARIMGYTESAIERIRDAEISQDEGFVDDDGEGQNEEDNTGAIGGYDFG